MEATFEQRLEIVLIRSVAGCWRLVKVERLSGGASQETYRINIATATGDQVLAMRRAAGGSVAKSNDVAAHSVDVNDVDGCDDETNAAEDVQGPGLQGEAKLFALAHEAGIPEPEVLYVLQANDELGEGFIMTWVAGETLGSKIAKAPAFSVVRQRLAYECGAVLARIHALDLKRQGLDNALLRLTPRESVEQTLARYQAYASPQPMLDYTGRWLLENLPAVDQLTLVHNDFRNGNLMVDPDKGLVAVLDWELAHIGDPMRDLGWLCVNSWRFGVPEQAVGGFGAREELFAGYQSVSGRVVDPEHVRFWEVFGSFWWSVTCLTMVDIYRSGKDASVERAAIGRRASEGQIDCVNLLIPGEVAKPQNRFSRSLAMPRDDELLASVRDYLRNEVMPAQHGRAGFLARVAANSLDVVMRELEQGPALHAYQVQQLASLLEISDSRDALLSQLCLSIRNGNIALNDVNLIDFLRSSVAWQVAIDQPNYSGLRQVFA